MPKISNLDQALKEQIKSLEPVQAEMVKSEMDTWKWNRTRIQTIEGNLIMHSIEGKERVDLINERHKLITENVSLYSHINRALKGTAASEDELDAFIAGD